MDRGVGATIVLFALVSVGVAIAPIQFSYVYSDSMAPTLEQHDGYVVYETNEVSVGDVIVFHAPEKGEYVTHRIVASTPQGFVTQGDANPSPDQVAGYDHVTGDHIVGRVVTIGGNPLRAPGVGRGIALAKNNWWILLGLAGVVLLASLVRTSDARDREVTRVRDIVQPLFLAALLTTVGLTAVAGQTTELSYVAVEGDVNGSRTVQLGEATTETVHVNRSTMPGTVLVITGDGMTITDRRVNGSLIDLTVRVPPPEQPGVHGGTLTITRYPAVLPRSTLADLHAIHPLVASIPVAVAVLGPVYLAYLLTIDGRVPLRPSRRRWRHGAEEER